jgi:shikimate dehydrogenase
MMQGATARRVASVAAGPAAGVRPIPTPDARPVVWFIGDDAPGSSAVRAVPRWAEILGRPMELRPVDLRPRPEPGAYEQIFEDAVGDPRCAGAVITGHKVGMYAAVGHRCHLSPDASRLQEINVVAVRRGYVEGHATDVMSTGTAVDDIWPRAGGTVVCLGGGGSARALCRHLLGRPARPRRIVVCERDPQSAGWLADVLARADTAAVELRVVAGSEHWDDFVGELGPGDLVVNATGLGKTDWRAPVSPAVSYPHGLVVWDLNYRGPLPFLRIAHHQQDRGLVIVDGARLFALGWLAALGALFRLDRPERFTKQFLSVAEDLVGGVRR